METIGSIKVEIEALQERLNNRKLDFPLAESYPNHAFWLLAEWSSYRHLLRDLLMVRRDPIGGDVNDWHDERRKETRTVYYAGRAIEVTATMRWVVSRGCPGLLSIHPEDAPKGVQSQVRDDLADWWGTSQPC